MEYKPNKFRPDTDQPIEVTIELLEEWTASMRSKADYAFYRKDYATEKMFRAACYLFENKLEELKGIKK